PREFLAKVFRRLLRHGVLVGRRGPGGGYRLAFDPRELPVVEVIEAASPGCDGPRPCFLFAKSCGDGYCSAHEAVTEAERGLRAALANLMLSDLLRDAPQADRTGGIVAMTRGLLIGFAVMLGASACKDKEMDVYRAPKEAAQAAMTAAPEPSMPPMAAAPAGMSQAGVDLPPPPPGKLSWAAPADWKSKPAGGMRFATFGVPSKAGEAELSVINLAGEAGGGLPNVNRWRGQLGLPPIDDAELSKVSQSVKSAAGKVLVVSLTGADGKSGLVGAILPQPTQTWFFKLTGSPEATGAAKPSFLKFLESLR
ncbi:MAG: Rrf2 family transcriptional regulator, partial [Elusimicrobia bacterium]|nr:Rrf2 family transcriptional regulator [Elusimicrobiota bacterium]